MLIFENMILNSIYLLFPLGVYLIYVAYIRNMDMKEKNLFLEFALLSSMFLLIRYTKSRSLYSIVLYNVPLLLAYLRNKTTTGLFISFILVIFYINNSTMPLGLLLVEYGAYLFLYLWGKNKNKQDSYLINGFVMIKFFLLSFWIFYMIRPNNFYLESIFYLIVTMITFICYTYLIAHLFKKGEEIVDLNATLQELHHEKMLRSSLSKLTHEVKNPIAVCKGYLEMIDKKGTEKADKYLPIINDEINRALTVITDFSNFGKLNSIEKEEVDLRLVLEEIIEVLNPLFKKYNDELKLKMKEEELYVELDYNRMKQVLVNIIKNALEARKEETPLTVEITVKKLTTDVKIMIKDNGTGMDKETLKRIDEMFYTTKTNGSGLGVILSKEIVELHHGTLGYTSVLNKGTTAIIKLPLK